MTFADWVQTIATLATGVAVVYAAVRQWLIWRQGWNLYGHPTRCIAFSATANDLWVVFCEEHGAEVPTAQPHHSFAHHIQISGQRVVPRALGTRHWTYVREEGPPLQWRVWLWRCFKLAFSHRFLDPTINLCPRCTDGDERELRGLG